MASSDTRTIFGPVPSRRLGLSLGVDLLGRKACTLDCVYCQVGRTTDHRTERASFVPVGRVLEELAETLHRVPRPDYITLSGSGEPTLHAGLGAAIDGIRRITDVPVAILTNGTLLGNAAARRDCAKADLVVPSLDAANEATYQRINRPAPGLTLEGLVDGLVAFRREFTGQLWLEVFLAEGINDSDDHVGALAELIRTVEPDRIQLNTATRPTADADVRPVSPERLARIAERFGPKAEVIASFRSRDAAASSCGPGTIDDQQVLAMIRRRPVTAEDIAAGLAAHPNEVAKAVGHLLESGRVRRTERQGRTYYEAESDA